MHADARITKAIEIAWHAGNVLNEKWALANPLEAVLAAYSGDPTLIRCPQGMDDELITNMDVWWSQGVARLCRTTASVDRDDALSPNIILSDDAVVIEHVQPTAEGKDTFGYTLTVRTERLASASILAFRPYWKDPVIDATVALCNGQQRVNRIQPYRGRWFTEETVDALRNLLLEFVPQCDFKDFDAALQRVTEMGRHGSLLDNHLALVFGKA